MRLWIGFFLLLALAPSASAADLTLGRVDLTGAQSTENCAGGADSSCARSLIPVGVPFGTRLSTPVDGHIVGWRFVGTLTPGSAMRLRVILEGPDGSVVSGPLSSPAAFSDGTLNPLADPLAIPAGGRIGVFATAPPSSGEPSFASVQLAPNGGASFGEVTGEWPEGVSKAFDGPHTPQELFLNADVEFDVPVVSSLTPSSGPQGTNVTIAGDHFTGATEVRFGTQLASSQVTSNTTIVANAPMGNPPGTVDVTVTGPGGTSATSAGTRYTYPAPSGGGGGDMGGGGAQPPDTTAPVISKFAMSPVSFIAANTGPSISSAVGADVFYRLTEAAQLTFTVQRRLPGVKKGGRCLAPKKSRGGRRCWRHTSVKGSFTHDGRAGLNDFRFMGRLAGKALKRGNYRLVAVARDTAGNLSEPVRRPFRIVR